MKRINQNKIAEDVYINLKTPDVNFENVKNEPNISEVGYMGGLSRGKDVGLIQKILDSDADEGFKINSIKAILGKFLNNNDIIDYYGNPTLRVNAAPICLEDNPKGNSWISKIIAKIKK